MTLNIELSDQQIAALKAKAAAEGLSLAGWLGKLAETAPQNLSTPKKSAYGLLAKYGPGPSGEEIDENRKEMFAGFEREFQMVAGVADTHTALWYLLKNPSLSDAARQFIERAAESGSTIAVSTISPVPRDAIPDMPDRIVAATALYPGVPVISRDGRIRASALRTVW